jgi:hypothetical protein
LVWLFVSAPRGHAGLIRRTSFPKAVESVTPAKISNVFGGVERGGAPFSTADKFLHSLSSLILLAEVTFANGFPHVRA